MKFVLASHGHLSEGMLDTLQMLLGPQEDVLTFVLHPEEEAARLGERMEAALEPEDEGNIVFFTDLYFGSPFNQVVNLSRNHAIYHVTGMNVPTLVEALVARNGGRSAISRSRPPRIASRMFVSSCPWQTGKKKMRSSSHEKRCIGPRR